MNVFGEALLLAGAVGSGMSGMWAHEQTILASERAKCDRTHAEAMRASQRAERARMRAERARMEEAVEALVDNELSQANARIEGLTRKCNDIQEENGTLLYAFDLTDARLRKCESALASTETSAQEKTAALQKALHDAEAALAEARDSMDKHAKEHQALHKTSHETHQRLLDENARLRETSAATPDRSASETPPRQALAGSETQALELNKLRTVNLKLQAAQTKLADDNARLVVESTANATGLAQAKASVGRQANRVIALKTANTHLEETRQKLQDENARIAKALSACERTMADTVRQKADEAAKSRDMLLRFKGRYKRLIQNVNAILDSGADTLYSSAGLVDAFEDLTLIKNEAVNSHVPDNLSIDAKYDAQWQDALTKMKDRLVPLTNKLNTIRNVFEHSEILLPDPNETDESRVLSDAFANLQSIQNQPRR